MLLDTDINEVVGELVQLSGICDDLKYDDSARLAGFAHGMQDALEIACSVLRCQQQVWRETQWKTLKAQLLAIGSLSWADSEKEPPGFYDGFCYGRRLGAYLAFSMVKVANGGEWKEKDNV